MGREAQAGEPNSNESYLQLLEAQITWLISTIGTSESIIWTKGAGRPIITLHGALASHRVWTRQFEAFSNRYRMIAIDFRGHGDSDKPKHGYDPVNLVKDIELLMSHLGLAKTLIIGSSMGGVIAQLFYFSRPAAVEALILVGTLAKAVWLGRRAEYLSELV